VDADPADADGVAGRRHGAGVARVDGRRSARAPAYGADVAVLRRLSLEGGDGVREDGPRDRTCVRDAARGQSRAAHTARGGVQADCREPFAHSRDSCAHRGCACAPGCDCAAESLRRSTLAASGIAPGAQARGGLAWRGSCCVGRRACHDAERCRSRFAQHGLIGLRNCRRGARIMIEVVRADITTLATDAIVNAANEQLAGGGGVDGAIHRAAGPELARASMALAPCPRGNAVITPGFRLRAKYVIHAVGPVWRGGTHGEEALLRSAYVRSFELALEQGDIRTIAFPGISAGAYGYPISQAAAVAVDVMRRYQPRLVRLVAGVFDAA